VTTFGKTSIGASYDDGDADSIISGRFTLTETGTVSGVSGYLDNQTAGHAACYCRGVIYSATGGNPTTLQAVSAPVALSDNQAPGWVYFGFSSPPSLPAADYWLGIHLDSNASGVKIYGDANGGYFASTGAAYGSGTPTTYPAGGQNNTNPSFYATYSTAPYFGNQDVTSPALDGGNLGNKLASKFTLTASGVMGNFSTYVDNQHSGHAANAHIKAAIYADSSGSPGALQLTYNASAAIADNAAAAWVALTPASQVTLPAGTYWLAQETDSSGIDFLCQIVGAGNNAYNFATYGTFSDPFGTSLEDWAESYCCYVTYTTGNDLSPLIVFGRA